MYRNYLKIAVRNLLKNKLYSFINLTCLSIGTSVVVLLVLYINNEWTFDQFHAKHQRIYRAWVKEHTPDKVFFNTLTPYVLGQELRDNFPEIAMVARYLTLNAQIKKGNFTERENVHAVEPQFLKMFDFPLLRGNVDRALADLHAVVITPEMAEKYFGEPAPIGKNLSLQIGEQWVDFTVSGVIQKAPENSSIRYDMLIPFAITKTFMSPNGMASWTNVNVETYVMLQKENQAREFEAKIAPFIDNKVAADYKPGKYLVGLQELSDIHLNKDFPEGIVNVSDSRYPYILAGVALLILALACINFTTLSIGRSVSRAKEVGVRKATGARRGQLMAQFWSEAVLTAMLAVVVGLLLAHLALPAFNILIDKKLAIDYSIKTFAALGGLTLLIGLLAGGYPSLVLSAFSPIKSLRGSLTSMGNNRHLVLRGLVGFQFVLSILLIICTLVMKQQMSFIQNKNLGYDEAQVVVLPYARTGVRLTDQWIEGKTVLDRLRNELGGKPGMGQLTLSTHTFGSPGWMNVGYREQGTKQFRTFLLNGVDENFMSMYGIQLLEGRNFSNTTQADQHAVIVNESYAKSFGLSVGQLMQSPFQEYTVIGIAKDFNFESLHSKIQPLLLAIDPIGVAQKGSDLSFDDSPSPKFSVKIAGDNLQAAITTLRLAWKQAAPEQAFDYAFLDQNIDQLYRSESRLSSMISLAAGLAIFIACLGLFGIATLTIAQRTKEIGVRKVLGASTLEIVFLLNKNFSILVLAAAFIATPLALYFLQQWLADFAYHVNIKWWVFVVAGLGVMAITLLTVSYQSVRAALVNPVKSLKTE
ncbi:MAG TPA: ABC transporter permease [Haliscomenobacter sp.]|uniref:ABC transporter permease n=1 Tax=Haliscomenobacter sp. TaxID=2717303 RepID=UPI002B92CB7A|nr:ABC transporter permease [Haliscomenobacter sp.]HOY15964.1 ABC transporter permease [Haliscomenobacter sp.]HPH18346.1 ABC transporter permease [Haliscomenobacter sp.]